MSKSQIIKNNSQCGMYIRASGRHDQVFDSALPSYRQRSGRCVIDDVTNRIGKWSIHLRIFRYIDEMLKWVVPLSHFFKLVLPVSTHWTGARKYVLRSAVSKLILFGAKSIWTWFWWTLQDVGWNNLVMIKFLALRCRVIDKEVATCTWWRH